MVRHHAPPALVTLWHPLDHHGQAIGSYQRELQTGDGVIPNAHNHALNQNQPNKEDKCLWSMHGRFGTVSNLWLIWRKPHDPVHDTKQACSACSNKVSKAINTQTRTHTSVKQHSVPSTRLPQAVQIQESWHCHFLREIQNASSHHGMI